MKWPDRPPSAKSAVPGYVDSIKMVATAFRASFRSRDESRHEAILKVDSDAMLIIPTLEQASFIATMTRQDVRDWLDTMVTLELKYVHLNTNPILRFAEVMSGLPDTWIPGNSSREWVESSTNRRSREL